MATAVVVVVRLWRARSMDVPHTHPFLIQRNDFMSYVCAFIMHWGTNNSCPIHYIKCTWLMCQIFPHILLCSFESCCLWASHLFSLLLSLGFPVIFLLFSLSWYPPSSPNPFIFPCQSPLPRWRLLSFRLSSKHLLVMPVSLTRPSSQSHFAFFSPSDAFLQVSFACFSFEVFYELHNILSTISGCFMEIEYLPFILFIVFNFVKIAFFEKDPQKNKADPLFFLSCFLCSVLPLLAMFLLKQRTTAAPTCHTAKQLTWPAY